MDKTLKQALEALKHAVYLLRKYADAEEMGGSRFDLTDCREMKPVFAAIEAIEQHKPVVRMLTDAEIRSVRKDLPMFDYVATSRELLDLAAEVWGLTIGEHG